MLNEDFDKLVSHFLNKKVISVEKPNAAEALAKFTMDDGSCFKLYANDLGYWIQDTVTGSKTYKSFNDMFNDYHDDVYYLASKYDYDIPNPKVTISNNVLEIESVEGKKYKANVLDLSEFEQEICNKAPEFISDAANLGDCWVILIDNLKDYGIEQI